MRVVCFSLRPVSARLAEFFAVPGRIFRHACRNFQERPAELPGRSASDFVASEFIASEFIASDFGTPVGTFRRDQQSFQAKAVKIFSSAGRIFRSAWQNFSACLSELSGAAGRIFGTFGFDECASVASVCPADFPGDKKGRITA